jgi:hypothetical protein
MQLTVIVPCFAHQYRLGLDLRLGCVYMCMEVSSWLASTCMYTIIPLHNVYPINVLRLKLMVHSQFRASQNRSAAGLLQLVVNKLISGCVRLPCTCLFSQVRNSLSTGLYKLLWKSCSNAVFNRPVASCWHRHRAAAMLLTTTCDRPVANRGKRLMKLCVSIFWTKKWPNRLPFSVVLVGHVVFRKIIRLLYESMNWLLYLNLK